jgi:hypothetical protein
MIGYEMISGERKVFSPEQALKHWNLKEGVE